jgi:porphobilinogen synthase
MGSFHSRGFPYHRGRRLRKNSFLREIVSETTLNNNDLIMPYFIREDTDNPNIKNMPDLKRFAEAELIEEVKKILDVGLKSIAIFPKTLDEKKTANGDESSNENNLVCRVLRKLKEKFPRLVVVCDVALDAYTISGHDGVINKANEIENDITIKQLSKMSINFAKNGCDIIAPSDMMDGRIKVIREKLEENGFVDTCILSYSSKFCSNLYSPFREALGSKNNLGKSNKSSYQIDFRNRNEAIKESLEDIHEGADIVMVKPAGYYLDIIRDIRNSCLTPIAAYQVSGEYMMIKKASENNIVDYKKFVLESLHCIKRAGANIIFSYFSKEVAEWLS